MKLKFKMPRTLLTCTICYKTKKTLEKHLRKKCMKDRSDEEIKATFAEAKRNLAKVAAKGLSIKYNQVAELVCCKRGRKNVIKFLSDRGFMIYNRPLVTSNGKRLEKKRRMKIKDSKPRTPDTQKKNYTDTGKKCGQPTKEKNPGCGHLSSRLPNKAVKKKQAAVIICDSETKEKKECKVADTQTVVIEPNYKWNHPLRKKMADAGMYRRHSLELEPLAGFQKYLSNTLRIVRYKQEVENVARFLFFTNSQKPALDFIYNIEKSNDFFDKLLEIGNTHQNVFNYLKNVKRFVSYLMNATSLVFRDKEMYSAAGIYLSQLGIFQKRLRRGIAKEYVIKKEKLLFEDIKRPDELALVLTNAEPAFKKALQMAENNDTLLKREKLIILYFLECLIILRKFQRPGVIQNMMIDEWKRRFPYHEDYVGISIHEHKTGANQIAVLILSKEEESWFKIYHDKVRPTFLRHDKEIQNFFLSSTGDKIYSVSNDINRFHRKFGTKSVTSQQVRRNAETFVACNSKNSNDKDIFAKYLAHSTATAERIYREKTMDSMVKASLMTSRLANDLQGANHLKNYRPGVGEVKTCVTNQLWKDNFPGEN